MKKLILTFSTIFLITTSCTDIHIKTTLNKNGSLLRSYEVSYSNSEKYHHEDSVKNEEQILPYDITWDTNTIQDTTNRKTIHQYSKTFITAAELQKTYETHEYLLKATNPQISYESHYNGIKTTYTYKEKFNGVFPCKNPHEVFTHEEIISIKKGDYNDNKELEDKFDLWAAYGYIELVKQIIDSVNTENLNLKNWETEIKLTINEMIVDNNKEKSKIENPDFTNTEYLIKTIEESIGKNIDNNTRFTLEKKLKSHINAYTTLLINNLTFSVHFSGELVKTNADSVINNTAYWTASPLLTGNELIMELESGNMNYSIFIVIIIAIVLIMLRRMWKKNL